MYQYIRTKFNVFNEYNILEKIYAIFIKPEFRDMSYAIHTYMNLASKRGYICSGEYRGNGEPTSFVSKDANRVWLRLKELFRVDKIYIPGNKFR